MVTAALGALNQEALKGLNGNNDRGVWFDETINIPLEKYWRARFQFVQRFANQYKTFYEERASLFLDYDLTRFFKDNEQIISVSLSPSYGTIHELKTNTKGLFTWVWISRYTIEGNLNFRLKEWDITHRGQLNYLAHNKNNFHDFGQYRHRVEVWTPWRFTPYNIRPYISNEWFFRENTYTNKHPDRLVGNWYQNRFRVGVGIVLKQDKLNCNLFWQWRCNKQRPNSEKSWFNLYDFGLSLFYFL